ncbi:unnamed protein product [Adineta ricciae]|uniref:thiopurine S-methyltransferase n=1 Tax=Adineta ricciae TaxID=249248 RepID=A0A814SQ38_ADIRI|nr:unnamed protein product [Adineta ricciae]
MTDANHDQQCQYSPKIIDQSYWNDRWLSGKIGFNRLTVNKHFDKHILSKISSIDQQQCVLFPLCGKTVDMKAVLDAGHRVIGIEYVQLGVEAFFEETNIAHEILTDEENKCQIYQGIDRPVTIYCTNFLTFNQPLPPIDWIFDRGGFVAVNVSEREQYRDRLLEVMTPKHTQLYLLASCYDQSDFHGPPRCVSPEDIDRLFGESCSTKLVEAIDTTIEFNQHNNQKLRRMEEHLHLIIRK